MLFIYKERLHSLLNNEQFSFSFCYLKQESRTKILPWSDTDLRSSFADFYVVRISPTIWNFSPFPWLLHAAFSNILLAISNDNFSNERERARERTWGKARYARELMKCFTWNWCLRRNMWSLPWYHCHVRICDITCHWWAIPLSYGKSWFNAVGCILHELCLLMYRVYRRIPTPCYAPEEGWETNKRKEVTSFNTASKPIYIHHSISSWVISCPSEYKRKWRLNTFISLTF